MKTENELFAGFMGLEAKIFDNEDFVRVLLPNQTEFWGTIWSAAEYHTSWDWLMPVVSKVNTLFDEDSLHGLDVDVYRSMQDWVASVNIQNAYADLVTIIKWYNENKQP